MNDIARQAGVSTVKVSHVINDTANVGDDRGTGRRCDSRPRYQPSEFTLARRTRRASLGCLCRISEPVFHSRGPRRRRFAYPISYRLMLCNTDNDSAKDDTGRSCGSTGRRV